MDNVNALIPQEITLSTLLRKMVKANAADLFITSGMPPSMRVHGKITAIGNKSLTPEQSRGIAYNAMTKAQREFFEVTHECNFAINPENIGRFRVNVFQQQYQVGLVARRIKTEIPTLKQLNLPAQLADFSMMQRGLVLVVGATGCGKSSALAAMIEHRNYHKTDHIVTIEDPIEYVHQSRNCIITQREVGVDTDSYSVGLSNALRQAPDVIFIGEVRHKETMEHAIAYAETGHLCLTTLHANNTYQAIDRMVNFFPKDRRDQLLMDLSLNLKAIVGIRLVPCKEGGGRIPAVEVFKVTPLASEMIHRGEIHRLNDLIKRSTEQKMNTFDQALYDLYVKGLISQEDAINFSESANEVRLMIKLGDKTGTLDDDFGQGGLSLLDDDAVI